MVGTSHRVIAWRPSLSLTVRYLGPLRFAAASIIHIETASVRGRFTSTAAPVGYAPGNVGTRSAALSTRTLHNRKARVSPSGDAYAGKQASYRNKINFVIFSGRRPFTGYCPCSPAGTDRRKRFDWPDRTREPFSRTK